MLHNTQDLAIQELKEQIGELMQKIDAKELVQKIEAKDLDLAIQLLTEQIGELCKKIDAKEFDEQLDQSKLAAMETKFDNFGIKLGLIGRQLDQMDERMQEQDKRNEWLLDLVDLIDSNNAKINAQTQVTLNIADKIDDIHSLLGDKIDDMKRGQERNADDLQKCVSQLFDENDDMRRWNEGYAHAMNEKIDEMIGLVSGNPQTQT